MEQEGVMRWIACSLTWMSVAAAVMYAISQTGRMACLWFLAVPVLVDWSSMWGEK